MQIDFHHTATYGVARLAGFAHNEASTIAYASQYVDDSTNKGTIHFDNGKTYERIASAHKVFDVANNCVNIEDYQVWFLFIFFPATTARLLMRRTPHSSINASCARQTVPYRRIWVKFQQRYVMSHRNVVNCLRAKAFGLFCSSHGDHPVSRSVLGA